jgi:RNA polymerase sigma-70 factor (ECF subfamily)
MSTGVEDPISIAEADSHAPAVAPARTARTRMEAESAELTELYTRFGPAVHRRALSITRDAEEALDVTQDTFMAYMNLRSSLRGEASPFTVLYQIATHRAVDRLRRRARWSGTLGRLDVEDEEHAEQRREAVTAHEGGMTRVEALQDLAVLTQGEKPRVLTAAILYFVEGYTEAEVGRVLDLERHTVSKLLRQFAERARKRSARLERGAPR